VAVYICSGRTKGGSNLSVKLSEAQIKSSFVAIFPFSRGG